MILDRFKKWKWRIFACFLAAAVIFIILIVKRGKTENETVSQVFRPLLQRTGEKINGVEFSWVTREEKAAGEKTAYLTFDDGPSDHTDQILDILKEKGVKATFFVVGKTGEKAEQRYRRIQAEGHTLALHSYSHDYKEIYGSLEQYKKDVRKLREYLEALTGEEIWLYRFPGGSSNRVAKISIDDCIDFLREEGLTYVDWNASSEDAVTVHASCSELNANILKDALHYNQTVILMHDLHECSGTVEGLGNLIDRLKKEGYEILPITRETRPVQHRKAKQVQKK